MRITILGKRYNLRFRWMRREYGRCHAPAVKGKEIRICTSLDEEKLLETLIHEILHAADWHKTEEWIEEVAIDTAKILWKLGYRRSAMDAKET